MNSVISYGMPLGNQHVPFPVFYQLFMAYSYDGVNCFKLANHVKSHVNMKVYFTARLCYFITCKLMIITLCTEEIRLILL